jgi:hypothetical protein
MIGSMSAKLNLAHPHDLSRDAKYPKFGFQLGFRFNFGEKLGRKCKPMEGTASLI